MELTSKKFRALCGSQAWRSAVTAYLLQRTRAEVMRKHVDAVHREILEECPIYADIDHDGGAPNGKQILRSKDLYLCSDEALCEDFYNEADHRLRACGLKPETMERDFCPALVEERKRIETEWFLINEVAGPTFGVDNDGLLSIGLEKRQQFIDLIVGAVVNTPGFKHPLTNEAVS